MPVGDQAVVGSRFRRARWRAAALALCALALPACSGPSKATQANDQLRQRNLELEREVESIRAELALRVSEVDALEQRVDAAPRVDGAKLPQATRIEIARRSGAIDTNGNGIDDVVRLYVKPTDQQGRFLVVAGRLDAQVVMITPDGARELIKQSFEPAAFDKLYRSGITGTHYAVELKLPVPLLAELTQLTAKVTFTDAATGVVLTDQQAMPVKLK